MLSNIKERLYKILRFSEKYTQTDMIYLVKGGFWLTFGQGVSMGTAFFLAIIFANFLPKETYGQYKYVISIFDILLLSNMAGINTSFTRAVARGFDGSIFKDLKTKLKWSIWGLVASLLLSLYYYVNGNKSLFIAFLVAAPFIVIFENFAIYSSYLHGKKQFDKLTKYSSIIKITSLIILGLTAYLSDNLYFLLLALFVPQTTLHIIFFIKEKIKNIFNNQKDADSSNYGKKLSFINIISTIANQLDKILIFHYLGAVDLAIYSFAMAAPEQIKGLMKNIQNLAFPKFAEKEKEDIKKTIFKKSLKLSVAMALVVGIYILIAPLFFKLFFPQYTEAVIYSQIFSISLLTLPVLMFQTALRAQKMTKQILQLDLISSLSQIALTFFLVSTLGLWGAIMARFAYRIINLFTSLCLFRKN